MCVFRADCLALDNQLVCSPLGTATSPAPSSPLLSIALCVGLRPCELFFIQTGVFAGGVLVHFTSGQTQ